MSDQGSGGAGGLGEGGGTPGADQGAPGYGGVGVIEIGNAIGPVPADITAEEVPGWVDEVIARAQAEFHGQEVAVVEGSVRLIGQAVAEGELTPTEADEFWVWMRFSPTGQDQLNLNDLTSGRAGRRLRTYEAVMARDRARRAPTATAPAPKAPHPAAKVVSDALLRVRGVRVKAPGLTPVEADAISKAIGVAYSDMATVTARAIGDMLPGQAPGQVPEALDDLFTAARILAHQVRVLGSEVAGKAGGHVAGMLHGLQETVHGLGQSVEHITRQLGEEAPSTLHTHVEDNTRLIGELGTRVNHIGEVEVAGMAAELAVVVHNLHNLNELTGGISSGQLQHDINALAKEVPPNLAEHVRQLEDCCAENLGTTGPIREGGATPSLLRKLGGLLGKAFEIGFVATLAEGLLAVADAPAVVSGVVADTEALTAWATQAAGAITSDLGWLGGLHG